MPKERTHWHLAKRAADRLPAGPLADAVLGYPEFLLAGAVSHDSAYYMMGDDAAKAAADRLHGVGGHDSFDPFRALARRAGDFGAAGLAFGFGALTHLAADCTFHPLVFSWTGDAAAPDPDVRRGWLYRHQACETDLDQHLQHLWGLAPAKTFGSLVRRGGRDLRRVHAAFSGEDSRAWVKAHGRLQGLFHHRTVRLVARMMAGRDLGGDSDLSGAFYGPPPFHKPTFEGTLAWVDPVTGEPGRATLDELVARFELLARDLAAEWQESWTTGAGFLPQRVGPALDTGIPCDGPQEKRFFARQGY